MFSFKRQQGITLVELLIALSIFAGLVVITTGILIFTSRSSAQEFLALGNVDQARLVTSQFSNELRNATTGVEGSYSLNQAGDQQIIFFSRAGTSGATVNRIRYYLTGTTLYKGVTTPSGNPPTYNLASEYIKIVQTDVKNGASPVFTYYDGDYDGTTDPLVQPINVNTPKYVKMNISVLTQVQAQGVATFSISGGASIRNLKTNLGN